MKEFRRWLEKNCCEECICHLGVYDCAKDACSICSEERERVWKAALKHLKDNVCEEDMEDFIDRELED